VVPKTRKQTSEVVTPGMKSMMSVMAPDVEKSGVGALARAWKFFDENKEKNIMTASNTLDSHVSFLHPFRT
jgi:hypothetical protein